MALICTVHAVPAAGSPPSPAAKLHPPQRRCRSPRPQRRRSEALPRPRAAQITVWRRVQGARKRHSHFPASEALPAPMLVPPATPILLDAVAPLPDSLELHTLAAAGLLHLGDEAPEGRHQLDRAHGVDFWIDRAGRRYVSATPAAVPMLAPMRLPAPRSAMDRASPTCLVTQRAPPRPRSRLCPPAGGCCLPYLPLPCPPQLRQPAKLDGLATYQKKDEEAGQAPQLCVSRTPQFPCRTMGKPRAEQLFPPPLCTTANTERPQQPE